ncbi:M50 family metallopeptidase [Actinoplanes sp. LDG1-06]|uniref:M50 family metallopeptidase n=1 Tax=Paractinoplanes ovalisporus TaxID=2810368 RepID=A0ABS2AKY6_9ACTN|nr:M50 family metallopeptidase [Actinoplanes ovalisporus]MBM2620433.1 M50 family metallopeptidase [Actinoplanes ovalisporus]
MLFALGEPVAFVALVVSFLLAIVLRAVAIRLTARTLGLADRRDSIAPQLREDIDPFGGVAAAIGGMGWGKMLSVDDVPRYQGRGKAIAVFAAGPVVCILASQLLLLTYALTFPDNPLSFIGPADVLLGIGLPIPHQVLLSLAVGLLCFGILALIPIPPLDGFGILYNAVSKPGQGLQWMRLWFEDKNIGVLVLLVLCIFPFGMPFLLQILNALGLVFVRVWG